MSSNRFFLKPSRKANSLCTTFTYVYKVLLHTTGTFTSRMQIVSCKLSPQPAYHFCVQLKKNCNALTHFLKHYHMYYNLGKIIPFLVCAIFV